MRIILSLLFVCTTLAIEAAPVQIENTRIWAAPDGTRIVFDVAAPVKHKLSMLSDPYRVVIDINNAELTQQLSQPTSTDKYLQRLRAARHNRNDLRIVLDLKKYSRSKSFQLKPNKHYGHRLVVDIFDTEADEKAKNAQLKTEGLVNPMRDVIIAIDAGHGGEDPGARGPRGTFEKDVILQLAKILASMVDKERGMRAVMTREGDYYLRLRKRINKARKHRADLFISLHADAFRDPSVSGSSVYVLSQQGSSSEHARWLAEQENASDLIGGVSLENKDDVLVSVLLDLSQTASLEASIDMAERVLGGLKQVGKVHKRRVEAAGFAVLKSPDVPSILVETAYISNPVEEKKLLNPAHQRKVAKAILNGLRGYFRDHAPEGTMLAARRHIIARGDTLTTIAQHYKVSLKTLRNQNRLKSDYIKVGQVLTIPTGSGGS